MATFRRFANTARLTFCALALGACQQRQRLVVYTAAEADQIPAYAASFKKAHPEIELLWVRDSTGVVTAKLMAERKAPRADVIFALAASSMIDLDRLGLLEPYMPKGEDRLASRFRDGATPPHWTGEALWSAAICVNRTLPGCSLAPHETTKARLASDGDGLISSQ